MTKTVGLVTALAVGGAIALSPGQAFAHEQSGFGIGADLTLGNGSGGVGVGGISGMYWVNPSIALNFIVNVGMALPYDPPGDDGGELAVSLGGAFGVFGVIASGDSTHLMLGGRLGILGVFNQSGVPDAEDNRAVISLDVPLRVEHWFDRHFSVNGAVGVGIGITPDAPAPGGSFSMILGSANAWGGIGFNFYFDPASGLGTGGEEEEHHHAEPPPRQQRQEPAYQPPPPQQEAPPPADPEGGSAGW